MYGRVKVVEAPTSDPDLKMGQQTERYVTKSLRGCGKLTIFYIESIRFESYDWYVEGGAQDSVESRHANHDRSSAQRRR